MILRAVTGLFPLWALVGAVAAYAAPGAFAPASPAILPLLGLVMFGMGMTLTPANFAEVLRRPGMVGLGVVLQYGIMPAAAFAAGRLLDLPPALVAGMVLVGSCPGGTASNVICYLGRGDVALSITLTAVSTLLAVLLTPALTWLYVGRTVPVPVGSMLVTIAEVVLVPVALGVAANVLAGGRLHGLKRVFPAVSVAAIVLIIAIVVALNRATLAGLAPALVAAVVLHNGIGLGAGYGAARLLGLDARRARTLAIEVGMQNSGLGVALAAKYLPAAAALPGAVFSVWHNLSGSALAAYWSRRAPGGEAGLRSGRARGA
ncbi:bile acid:sodium symporter family protein [Thiohalorhabdus methylotrophus]|uniref:Bile acid:sodium symporter family protein n=1 Tax=Thiohalorhabdus methylotrophus TaxID=3242694 RepID=A0ABV4TTD8_9GAMM